MLQLIIIESIKNANFPEAIIITDEFTKYFVNKEVFLIS